MEPQQNNVNMSPESRNSTGLVIGIIIILALIILGGLYFWNQRANDAQYNAETGAVIDSINAQSSSDDTTSIEADLNSTNIENLDAELNAS